MTSRVTNNSQVVYTFGFKPKESVQGVPRPIKQISSAGVQAFAEQAAPGPAKPIKRDIGVIQFGKTPSCLPQIIMSPAAQRILSVTKIPSELDDYAETPKAEALKPTPPPLPLERQESPLFELPHAEAPDVPKTLQEETSAREAFSEFDGNALSELGLAAESLTDYMDQRDAGKKIDLARAAKRLEATAVKVISPKAQAKKEREAKESAEAPSLTKRGSWALGRPKIKPDPASKETLIPEAILAQMGPKGRISLIAKQVQEKFASTVPTAGAGAIAPIPPKMSLHHPDLGEFAHVWTGNGTIFAVELRKDNYFSIRHSQLQCSEQTGEEAIPIHALAAEFIKMNFKEHGALQVVKMPDGEITSLNNRRVVAIEVALNASGEPILIYVNTPTNKKEIAALREAVLLQIARSIHMNREKVKFSFDTSIAVKPGIKALPPAIQKKLPFSLELEWVGYTPRKDFIAKAVHAAKAVNSTIGR